MNAPAAIDATAPLRLVLAAATARAPAAALPALEVAGAALRGLPVLPALREASASLRAAYEAAAPARQGAARHEHEARFRAAWADPCGDPAELRPLAACVAAVYAVEAWAAGERETRVDYYTRAAWGWLS